MTFYSRLCMIFTSAHIVICSHRTSMINGSQIVLIAILGLLNRSLCPNIWAASLRQLILQGSSLSMILTLPHKCRWFPFSFHIWTAILDFSLLPRYIPFRFSASLSLSGWFARLCILYHSWDRVDAVTRAERVRVIYIESQLSPDCI